MKDPQVKTALREREERYLENLAWLDQDLARRVDTTIAMDGKMTEIEALMTEIEALMASGDFAGVKVLMEKMEADAVEKAIADQIETDREWAITVVGAYDTLEDLREAMIPLLMEATHTKRTIATTALSVHKKDKGDKEKVVKKTCVSRKCWENKKCDKLPEGVWRRSFNDLKSCDKTLSKNSHKYCDAHYAESQVSKSGLPIDGDFGVKYDWPAHQTDPKKIGWLSAMRDRHPQWVSAGQLGACGVSKSPVKEKVELIEGKDELEQFEEDIKEDDGWANDTEELSDGEDDDYEDITVDGVEYQLNKEDKTVIRKDDFSPVGVWNTETGKIRQLASEIAKLTLTKTKTKTKTNR